MTTTPRPATASLPRRVLRAVGSVMLVAMVAFGVLPTATAQAAGVATGVAHPAGTTAMADPASTRLAGTTSVRYRVTGTGLTRI
ncbi:hypothetical protein [Nostocoides japonicum]|uniref:hypothetical protein n=1 Tax=Nostocoides japonicum TaxID=99481 RepID=UPI000B07CACA|nr:hypothetical protein [Tetrasphaera japonica]